MQSNCYNWSTYHVPCIPPNDTNNDVEIEDPEDETFTIRHLKQGGTGARKTWQAAEVLLDYLVCRGGFRPLSEKVDCSSSSEEEQSKGCLDLTSSSSSELCGVSDSSSNKAPLNVIELGGGTGFLSIGLAMAMQRTNNNNNNNNNSINLICTDNDKPTIKNMRHNISRQPKEAHLHKTVKIQHLDWGDDIGGEAFSKALQSHFQDNSKQQQSNTNNNDKDEDPMNLVSHIIASDVLYGATTLEPLSSIISALKLRNPQVVVILLLRERQPNSVIELKHRIESKLKSGLCDCRDDDTSSSKHADELGDFAVSVRDVLHDGDELPLMKMVEC